MALSVDWPTGVITVPKADLTLVQLNPTEIRELDTNQFRLELKALEAEADEGISWTLTHVHNPPLSVGGVELARTVEILEPYTITFEDGQYAVNLIGSNNNIGDRVNVNQVSVRSANSAGLVTSAAIEFGEYGGEVHFDPLNSTGKATSGSTYPIGTLRVPVDNIADAVLIAQSRGFNRIKVLSNYTFTTGDNVSGYIIVGQNSTLTSIVVETAANVTNCTFKAMTIEGVLDGGNSLEKCVINDLDYFNGTIRSSTINTGITLGGGVIANIYDSFSGVPGLSTPYIDMGGSGNSLALRAYSGGIEIRNKTGPDAVSLDFISGQAIVDSTVTGGTVVIRGNVKITDNHGGTANVESDSVIVADSFFNDGIWIDNINGIEEQTYPTGIASRPVKGNDNTVALASRYGVTTFNLIGTLVTDRDFPFARLRGDKAVSSDIVIFDAPGYNFSNSQWERVTATGIVTSGTTDMLFEECIISNFTNIDATLNNSILGGTISINGNLRGKGLYTIDRPTIIDYTNASANGVKLSFQSAHLDIQNLSAGITTDLSIFSGAITVNANCTGGTIHIHGNVILTDNSGGAVTIENFTEEELASNRLESVADIVWDEPLTGNNHSTPTTAGRRLRELASSVIVTGTAVSNGNGYNQIVLDNDASAVDGAYDPALISIVHGTGMGQTRGIYQYDGATKIATVDRNWKTQPDATSEYIITGWAGREHVNEGLSQGGTANTITLNPLASSADDSYKGQLVFVRSGPAEDQVRLIIAYNGTTKVATVAENWSVIPNGDSGYVIIPDAIYTANDITDAILDADLTTHTDPDSVGEALDAASNNEKVEVI